MKECVKCKKLFPRNHDYFYYRNKMRGWFSSWCKKCAKSNKKDNMEREMMLQRNRRGVKPCHVCGTNEKTKGNKYCCHCLKKINTERKREDKALYKSKLRKAKTKWANPFFLREIYSLARLRTKLTGIDWHVDHIIPLRNRMVCGLHTENNLRVITSRENQIKGNHYSFEHNGSK